MGLILLEEHIRSLYLILCGPTLKESTLYRMYLGCDTQTHPLGSCSWSSLLEAISPKR